jgi:excinuclease ABC subunit A
MDLLFKLRDAGNTILIIEHDLDVIRMADWILELGPEGGQTGGEILFQGEGIEFFQGSDSPTQSVLS